MCDRFDSVENFAVRLLAKRPVAGGDALLRCSLPPILVFGSREKDRGVASRMRRELPLKRRSD